MKHKFYIWHNGKWKFAMRCDKLTKSITKTKKEVASYNSLDGLIKVKYVKDKRFKSE